MSDPVLEDMNDLVARDHATAGPPDVAGLLAGGRRRVLRRRLAVGGVAAAVALAVVVPLAVVGGDDGGRAVEVPPATQSATPSPAPTSTPSVTESAPAAADEEVRVPLPGGGFTVGILETGTVLGARVAMAPYEGYDRFAYAARNGDSTCLSVGLRVEGRTVRLLCALTVPIQDRWVMWNGYREGDGYELLGVFEGDTSVSIGPAGGSPRAVTTRRTDVLPGYTVVLDQAPWDQSWDPLQAAPLTVTTGSGDTYTLRRNSYVS